MGELPRITVTMLGHTGSGKTTYLHGMYAILSGGRDGYFLHARDHDLDLDLSEAWDALLDRGELPPPNLEEPLDYDLIFKDGITPLIEIDWQDYRGGAMSDKSTTADTATLIERLNYSHSIYLTLDGAHLRRFQERGFQYVQRQTKAHRMTSLLQMSLEKREEPPSLVVLVTKADLLDDPSKSEEQVKDDIDQAVRELLPICFTSGVTSMICLVSLGIFGDNLHAKVDPDTVSPRRLHMPMVFSLFRFLEQRFESSQPAIDAWERSAASIGTQLQLLQQQFTGRFQKSRQAELLRSQRSGEMEAARLRAQHQQDLQRVKRLVNELRDLRVFMDGKQMEWVDA